MPTVDIPNSFTDIASSLPGSKSVDRSNRDECIQSLDSTSSDVIFKAMHNQYLVVHSIDRCKLRNKIGGRKMMYP